MIKILTKKDQKLIENFAYQKEKENMFIFWHLKNKQCFKVNKFFGYFDNNELIWLAVYFWEFKSLTINSKSNTIINKLVDYAIINEKIIINYVPVFKKYWTIILKRLKYHKIVPQKLMDDVVLILKKKDFIDFSTWLEKIWTKDDIDKIIMIQRMLNNNNLSANITNEERKRTRPQDNFIIKKKWQIVSKSTLSWVSKNYIQIIWVITDPKHRKKWYWLWVTSFLCKKYFSKWIKYALLFTDRWNIAAISMYEKMWFKIDSKCWDYTLAIF